MRLFFAVTVGPPAAGVLQGALRHLAESRADVKWTRGDALHMTLAFLGEQSPERAGAAARAGKRVRRAAIDASFEGLGVFPSWDRPRVLWTGLADGAEALSGLAKALRAELEGEGFEIEKRAFLPHATLGRLRSRKRLDSLRRRVEKWSSPDAWGEARFRVSEFLLLQSFLKPQGAVHEVLERIPLTAGGGAPAGGPPP